jgi:hypothetical protein
MFQVFWQQELPALLKAKFPEALGADEQPPAPGAPPRYAMQADLCLAHVFRRIQQLTGIKLSRTSYQELESEDGQGGAFRMVLPDIKKISARVKGLNILSLAEGNSLTIQVRAVLFALLLPCSHSHSDAIV